MQWTAHGQPSVVIASRKCGPNSPTPEEWKAFRAKRCEQARLGGVRQPAPRPTALLHVSPHNCKQHLMYKRCLWGVICRGCRLHEHQSILRTLCPFCSASFPYPMVNLHKISSGKEKLWAVQERDLNYSANETSQRHVILGSAAYPQGIDLCSSPTLLSSLMHYFGDEWTTWWGGWYLFERCRSSSITEGRVVPTLTFPAREHDIWPPTEVSALISISVQSLHCKTGQPFIVRHQGEWRFITRAVK